MDFEAKMLALSTIAHRSRLDIFRTLVTSGVTEMSAGQISGHLEIVPSSLSFHLKDMLQARLVSARRQGTFIYYSPNVDTLRGAIDLLKEMCAPSK